jgi:hypothetical protein
MAPIGGGGMCIQEALISGVRISLAESAFINDIQGFSRIGSGFGRADRVQDFLTRESGCRTRIFQPVLTATQNRLADHELSKTHCRADAS